MCGLVGMAGNLQAAHEHMMKHMLIFDSVRGVDSTGIAAIDTMNNVKMAKSVGDPYMLMETAAFERVFRGLNNVYIGHNRFSTVGKSTRANAHPFAMGNIVGAHNGTLTSKHALLDGNDFNVDSQAVFHHIDQKGVHDALTKMAGAWALTWWDNEEARMHFLRNKERPLWLCWNKPETAIFWASEPWIIEVAASRNKVELQEPWMLKEDTHWAFKVGKQGKIEDYIQEDAKGSFPAPIYTTHHNHGGGTGASGSNASVFPFPPAKTGGASQHGGQQSSNDSKSQPSSPASKWKKSGDDSYTGSKGVLFTALAVRMDANGANYLTCSDAENPNLILRLYMNKRDNIHNYVGKAMTGDIGGFYTVGGEANKPGYYKIDYGSVRLCKLATEKEKKQHVDSKGNPISEEEFMSQYMSCCWCTGWVNPDLPYGFSNSEAICSECVDDTEVAKYTNIIKHN